MKRLLRRLWPPLRPNRAALRLVLVLTVLGFSVPFFAGVTAPFSAACAGSALEEQRLTTRMLDARTEHAAKLVEVDLYKLRRARYRDGCRSTP